MPWRFYVLEKSGCCAVLDRLRAQALAQPDSKWSRAWESKLTRVLSGTGTVVLTTWLPEPAPSGGAPELNENNQEHIAAASAAVQNLLLAAEARGLRTYWSTGGILKDVEASGRSGFRPIRSCWAPSSSRPTKPRTMRSRAAAGATNVVGRPSGRFGSTPRGWPRRP